MDNYVDKLWNETDTVAALDALVDVDTAVTVIKRDMFNSLASIAYQIFMLEEEVLVSETKENRINYIKRTFSTFEKRYKKEKKVKHMPGSYRSAKSVILQALRVEVDILDPGGEPRGKTEIEKDISRARKDRREPKSGREPGLVDFHVREAAWTHLACIAPGKVSIYDPEQVERDLTFIEERVKEVRKLYLGR